MRAAAARASTNLNIRNRSVIAGAPRSQGGYMSSGTYSNTRIRGRRASTSAGPLLTWPLLTAALLFLLVFVMTGFLRAQAPPQDPSQFDMTGFIQSATLDANCINDPLCGGTITVNNQVIRVPRNTILQMPAAALTWQQLFAMAPAPYGLGNAS